MQSTTQNPPAPQTQTPQTPPAQSTPARAPRGGERRAQPPAPKPPPEFQSEKLLKLDEPALIAILKDPAASVFQKNIACRRLALIGTKASVPALAALLTDEKLAHYARFGLKPIPDASVDEALRAAIPKLKGGLLVGVINTIGNRQDALAVPVLTKLLYGPDTEAAEAAASAIGYIGGATASKTIQAALARTKGSVRDAVADAGLVCAEGLLAKGDRRAALALYDILSRTGIPKNVRLAALHSTFAAETAYDRPRAAAPAGQSQAPATAKPQAPATAKPPAPAVKK
jgi:HEAT repeat protein